MFTELTAELLDLTSSEKGHLRATYAVRLPACCSCSCCTCIFNC